PSLSQVSTLLAQGHCRRLPRERFRSLALGRPPSLERQPGRLFEVQLKPGDTLFDALLQPKLTRCRPGLGGPFAAQQIPAPKLFEDKRDLAGLCGKGPRGLSKGPMFTTVGAHSVANLGQALGERFLGQALRSFELNSAYCE